MTAWTPEQPPTAVTPGAVTLIEGTAFCVCDPSGDITPGGTQGIYVRDTRLVSRWQLLVDGELVEPLSMVPAQPFCATFVGRGRPRPGQIESTVLVTRERYVGDGLREDIAVRNFSGEPAGLHISLQVESDLANIFDVKSSRVRQWGQQRTEAVNGGIFISSWTSDRMRGVRVTANDAVAGLGELSFDVVVPPRQTWRDTVTVQAVIDQREVAPYFPAGQPVAEADPARRLHTWERDSPQVSTDHAGLLRALRRSRADLGSLRIFDADRPDQAPGVAAGAPWFMTIFGRDSLLTSWMALPLDRSLALGTVQVLASLQGEGTDAMSEEEPGKIIHELRHGLHGDMLPMGHRQAYFGSVDATPLFVMVVGELVRWGADDQVIGELLPHVDRALRWIENFGDADGDSFVEYRRKTDRGLANQGWKDSFDGINFADGTLAQAPIALAEVQGYVYGAYMARADIAQKLGDEATGQRCAERAAALKQAFNETLWLPDKGWYAVGLDRHKRPIDALASNMGHCLLTGIVDEDKAAAVADRLLSPEMFSGWGVRTLASSMGAYNPMSYHNGSVWPHDSALTAAGLMRYGYVGQAQRIAVGLLDAADAFGGRLPELFCTGEMAGYYRAVSADTSLIAISDSQRRLAPDIRWGGIVCNAVKVADFRFRTDKDDYVLFLGRMNPDKGAHLAIDAARAAGRRIVLAGKLSESHEQAYFDAEVKPRLGADAEFIGEADMAAKQELYGAAHCLVFPIRWDEPFGLVMIEAMACGTPVVALRRGSVPDVVLDSVIGFVRDDPADLPAAIAEAGSLDPAACRRRAEECFDVSAMAAGYERAYQRACQSGGDAPDA